VNPAERLDQERRRESDSPASESTSDPRPDSGPVEGARDQRGRCRLERPESGGALSEHALALRRRRKNEALNGRSAPLRVSVLTTWMP
jgi:hypothetical protein